MKHLALKLGFFLLLGAIINIALAWVSAMWVDGWPTAMPGSTAVTSATGNAWSFTMTRRAMSTFISAVPIDQIPPVPPPDGAGQDEVSNYIAQVRWWETWKDGQSKASVGVPPYWSCARRPVPSDAWPKIDHFEDARGWPLRSLMVTATSVIDPKVRLGEPSKIEWALRLNGAQGPRGFPRWLPLRPIWPGFVANTLMYAIGLWLLVAAPFQVRRWRRCRCGRCIKCGYDLRGRAGPSASQVCPECGAALK